jgi:N-acyl-L-homoserine lactone synthetase
LAARAAPVTFAVTRSDEERAATWRLRWQAVVDNGWAEPTTMPGGIERDGYDDGHEIVVVGQVPGRVIASGRIILPSPSHLLPVESAFGVRVQPPGEVAHIDRLVVDRAYTDANHRMLGGVLAACWLEMRARGYRIAAGADSPAMVRLFRMLGMRISPIGPPRLYWGEERLPCIFDPGGEDIPVP